ncbi:hypothetical protein M8009_14690 [Halomonas sp. ATCH28]|uniref:Uncharacterized protein n=1 Tax=Halomonas gemina TaxID=2945105 RepID=A0ABT0T474_9GAMM|nr:hypothetical protein [Halomonas gemina]MCL7941534.1 hypothetical protein [Halomonas gemina]
MKSLPGRAQNTSMRLTPSSRQMIVVALACLPICFTGGLINRWEGAMLLAYHLAYTLYLILAATYHDALPAFSATLLYYFALPLTALTLAVLVMQERRRRS